MIAPPSAAILGAMTRALGFARGFLLSLKLGLSLVLVLGVGFCALAPEIAERRARAALDLCDFRDEVIVSVAGHQLGIAAGKYVNIMLDDVSAVISRRTETYRQASRAGRPARLGFCLEPEAASEILQARRVSFSFDAAGSMAKSVGLPVDTVAGIALGELAMFGADLPAAVEDGSSALTMQLYRRVAEHDSRYLVTRGVTPDGFRIAARCSPTAMRDVWACTLTIRDAELGLGFRFSGAWYRATGFDGRPVPEAFHDAARKLRSLVGLLTVAP